MGGAALLALLLFALDAWFLSARASKGSNVNQAGSSPLVLVDLTLPPLWEQVPFRSP